MDLLASGAHKIGVSLSSAQLKLFETYCRELTAWNSKFNLTAITDYKEVQARHFLDSLSVALALPQPLPPGLMLLDVGAGAGFPGIPLKIAYSSFNLTLLEATGKKAAFLKHAVSLLGLDGVNIIAERAEDAAHHEELREKYDAVVSRAVAELPSLMELTLPFCRVGGRVIAQKKGRVQEEIDASTGAMQLLGGRLSEVKEVMVPGLDDRRFLVVIEKIAPTPLKYPRRAGMPVKRPLR